MSRLKDLVIEFEADAELALEGARPLMSSLIICTRLTLYTS